MTYHLPYSESPSDEFCSPTGEWLCTLRAITFDSWLLWRHALPEDLLLWPELTQPVFDSIVLLAQRIHNLHQLLPDYRRLADTPFQVSMWWDPTDDDFAAGDRVQLRIIGYTAREIEQEVPHRLKSLLTILPLSTHWVEISLPQQRPAIGTP